MPRPWGFKSGNKPERNSNNHYHKQATDNNVHFSLQALIISQGNNALRRIVFQDTQAMVQLPEYPKKQCRV